MGIEVIRLNENNRVKLIMPERFDFNLHREFREAYEGNPDSRNFIIDFEKTEYLDSSALGMLLLLKEHAGDSGKVEIVNSKADVLNVLKIANFDKLFEIH